MRRTVVAMISAFNEDIGVASSRWRRVTVVIRSPDRDVGENGTTSLIKRYDSKVAGVLTGVGQSTLHRQLFCVPYAPEQTTSGSASSQILLHGSEQQEVGSLVSISHTAGQDPTTSAPRHIAGQRVENKNEKRL